MPSPPTPPPIYSGGVWTLREKRLITAAVAESVRTRTLSEPPWICISVGLGDAWYYLIQRLDTEGEMMLSGGVVSLALDILMDGLDLD